MNPWRVSAAERGIELLTTQLNHARRHHERIRKLSERGAAALDEDDRAETEALRLAAQVRVAEAELEHYQKFVRDTDRAVAEARVALAQARLESARRELDEMELRAPFDGTVLEILKREGERAQAVGDAAVVFADTSRLRVRAEIDERYVYRLVPGQKVVVSGRGIGERRFRGRLSLVKQLMGKKTVFTREAAERKDLDVLQCWIELSDDFQAPLGLQVDIEVDISPVDLAAEQTAADMPERVRGSQTDSREGNAT